MFKIIILNYQVAKRMQMYLTNIIDIPALRACICVSCPLKNSENTISFMPEVGIQSYLLASFILMDIIDKKTFRNVMYCSLNSRI